MPEDDALTKLIGTRTSSASVVVERGPVGGFALAVCDQNPIYRDPRAATAAGFDSIPSPPTFPFVMETWGRFAELQPAEARLRGRHGEGARAAHGQRRDHPARRAVVRLSPPGRGRRRARRRGHRRGRVHEGVEGSHDDVRRHRDRLAGPLDRRSGRDLTIQRHPSRLSGTPPKGRLLGPDRRRLTIGVVLVVSFIALEAISIATALPVVERHLGDIALYGWTFSAFMLAALVGNVIAGTVSDRGGPEAHR